MKLRVRHKILKDQYQMLQRKVACLQRIIDKDPELKRIAERVNQPVEMTTTHMNFKRLSTNYHLDRTMIEVYGVDSDVLKELAKRVIEDELGGMVGEFIKYKDVEIIGDKYVYGSLYVGVDDNA